MPEDTSASRFGYVAKQRPEFAQAFGTFFQSAYRPENGVLKERERILIYLAVLASIGAVDGFRAHLRDAEREGISADAILEAILTVVPAVGYPRVMDVVEALAEYEKG